MTPVSPPARRVAYLLFIIVTAAMVSAWIQAIRVTESVHKPAARVPGTNTSNETTEPPRVLATFADNDRSRWDTIRALVDQGTYVIGHRDSAKAAPDNPFGDDGIVSEDGWKTIDKVLRPDNQNFYSSKPPFLPTILAGEYWLVKKLFGWSITTDHGLVVRTILYTANVLPLVLYLLALGWLVEDLGTTDWGRLFVMASASFATFVTPFSTTLNNHTVASWGALFSLYAVYQLFKWETVNTETSLNSRRTWPWMVGAGLFAGFTACTELPAAAFAVSLMLALVIRWPRLTLLFFVPAAAVPCAGFLATNYLAIGQWAPAYSELGGPWYQYAGSHWRITQAQKTGIDWAHDNKLVYSFHLLLGHHGLFSLTPVFLLSLVGLGARLRSRKADDGKAMFNQTANWLTLTLAIVVIGFYIVKTNNYGGWTGGPRWLMWLTPFFLITMIPSADWLAKRQWGRTIGYALLALSVLSATYPSKNPWRHPWLYDWWEREGWIKY